MPDVWEEYKFFETKGTLEIETKKTLENWSIESTRKPAYQIGALWHVGIRSRQMALEQRIAERLRFAAISLDATIEIDPHKRGGVPVIKGTRFTVAQLLGEVADGYNITQISDDLDLDVTQVKEIIHGFAIYLDRPFFK